jgi:glycosyltransferase involved in cell wall biosynthesis
VAGRFAHVTGCDDRHLSGLYQRATFAVYPSLYEGWGLGVTEALAHGRACLIASGSSLGEAGLGVCRELHPLRTADWVQAMAEYFDSPPPVPAMELPTWRSAAEDLLALVRQ